MFKLAFSEKSLEVQRNVVTEEFRQTHLNQPYGDVWLHLRPLAYKVHPYLWPTIGKEISHIQDARMEDVRAFYEKYYNPNNAVMVVAGNVDADEIYKLTEKWFAPIGNTGKNSRNLPVEPAQQEERMLEVERNVPANAIYKAWHMCNRTNPDYYTSDLLSDILGNGNSSRFYNELVKNRKLFSSLDAYIMGSFDNGLFVVSGKIANGISMKEAEKAIDTELNKLKNNLLAEREISKVKNKVESNLVFARMNVLDKAINLAFAEVLGDADMINQEAEKYQAVTTLKLRETAQSIFQPGNCSTLYYLKKK